MIANRDQRYSRIAKACLAVLNRQDNNGKDKTTLIENIYTAIDSAFTLEQKKMLADLEKAHSALQEIHHLADNGDLDKCKEISEAYTHNALLERKGR